MAKKCPYCGNTLKDKSTFCGKCGKKWDAEPSGESKAASVKNAPAFLAEKKKWIIGIGALVLAAVLLLIIINPANSPKSVFNRYLDCLHTQNEKAFSEISYQANFSSAMSREDSVDGYKSRFTSFDPSNQSGSVDLLKNTQISIIKEETPKQSDIAARRTELKETYRNTERITDIRKITFEIKRSEEDKSTGTAELICVTGKWYIGDVSGI